MTDAIFYIVTVGSLLAIAGVGALAVEVLFFLG